jgi:hypothetical protein
VLVMPGLHSAHITSSLGGGGSTIGPLLMGMEKPCRVPGGLSDRGTVADKIGTVRDCPDSAQLVCAIGRKMEPQNTQNTQRVAVPYTNFC